MAGEQLADLIPPGFFVSWYRKNGRDFPWRSERVTPFQLLLTEMLLRQTQAVQVESVWEKFMSRFGTPSALKKADREEIGVIVGSLGFINQRTRALKAAAKHITAKHGGQVPSHEEALLEIPHIGPYSTRAVRCFAFEKRVPIVDTNVLRFLCRATGRQVKRPDIRRTDWAWEDARSLLPESGDKTVNHNYGLLDFTAAICVAQNPECESCRLSSRCAYGRALAQEDEPTKAW